MTKGWGAELIASLFYVEDDFFFSFFLEEWGNIVSLCYMVVDRGGIYSYKHTMFQTWRCGQI
jgi:hypothetical protein